MMFWLWLAVGLLALTVALLLIKLHVMKSATDELEKGIEQRLGEDTNTLLDINSHDRHIRRLASTLNRQLRDLRDERHRFQQGDTELKEAVSNIAHDLRTPLTAISGYLQLLEQEECGEAVRRHLDLMSNRTKAMKQLTDELFRYSVLSSQPKLRFEPVKLNAVLEESLAATYNALTQRAITPEIIIPEEKVERLLDRSALSRVFENILQNAVKYSAGDLRVELCTDGSVTFSNYACGLDTVSVGRLFDRFYTVETGRNSTGLGLSIAKLLTERMGGKITAEYQQGKLLIRVSFGS